MSEFNVDYNELPFIQDIGEFGHALSQVERSDLSLVHEWFSEESLTAFFEEYSKSIKGHENYYQINSFLDGSPAPYEAELQKAKKKGGFKHLAKMPTSLRLTNAHKFIMPAKQVCHNIFQETGVPAVCNMYITPSEEKNCFNFHSDYQDNIIQQLKGSKLWIFPISSETNDLKIQAKAPFSQFYETNKSLKLEEGKSLFFGNSVVHKAQALSGDVSIHLTYAIFTRTQLELREFFALKAFEAPGKELIKKKVSDLNELVAMVDSAKANAQKISSIDLIKEYFSFIEQENLKVLKKGRRY